MRLPTYLILRNGGFCFRIIVPLRIREALGRKVIKHALNTRDARLAQVKALYLAIRYLKAFDAYEAGSDMTKTLEELLSGAQKAFGNGGAREYTFKRGADGTVEMSADGPEDHARLMEAVALQQRSTTALAPPQAVREELSVPVSDVVGIDKAGIKSITVAVAAEKYLQLVAHTFKDRVKTRKKIETAMADFVKFTKSRTLVHNIAKHDLANFTQSELNKGLSRSTVNSTLTWVRGFFKWAMASGYYPDIANPGSGHVTISVRDKKKAAAKGWEPFSTAQLNLIFEYGNFRKFGCVRDRWVSLIALYTGARSNEISLLELDDIIQDNAGVWLFDFNVIGQYKNLKTDASERKTPIHPDLIKLGLLTRVSALRLDGHKELFPDLNFTAQNGPANAPQRAFSRYIDRLGVKARHGIMGLHSFRDTAITAMAEGEVGQGWREQYVGHDESEGRGTRKTSHAMNYTGPVSATLAKLCHPPLDWERKGVVNIQAIKTLL